MPKLKFFWGVILLLLLTHELAAQTSVGFRGGYSISNVSYRASPGSRTERVGGVTAPTYSLVIEQFLAKNAGAQLEIQYLQLGYTQRDTLDRTNQSRLNYIKVPLMSNFYFGNRGRFHIKIGTHVGYLMSASDESREYEGSTLIPTYGGENDRPNKILYGLSAGAGLSNLFGKSTLAGEVRFSYDFNRLEAQNRIFDMTSTNLEVTLSYLFQVVKPKWKNE
ncbi:porin family protein [Belliella kenyensis]|uniref:Porin family protein n=1 Tax=Belliella kenyensis TaxID=1472724 RepID=A0ABV8EQ46_9BACT|nr:porin family protein [Belliella kenyensis]MCH7402496.1 PorT family protein [Belliella kenyensis]MDN3603295.1 porin family protein [Belliella kenyensis]